MKVKNNKILAQWFLADDGQVNSRLSHYYYFFRIMLGLYFRF